MQVELPRRRIQGTLQLPWFRRCSFRNNGGCSLQATFQIYPRSSPARLWIPTQQRGQGEPQGSTCPPHMLCRSSMYSLRWDRSSRPLSRLRSCLESRKRSLPDIGSRPRSRPGSSCPSRTARRCPTCFLGDTPSQLGTSCRRRCSSRLRSGCMCPLGIEEHS